MWEERLRTSPAPFLVLIRGKRNDSLAEKEPTDFGRLLLEALPAARDLGTDPPALPWAPSGCSPMLLCLQGCEEIGGDWRPSVERDRSPERPGEECGPRESLLRETGANAGFSRSWDRFFLLLSRLRGVARWRLTAQASRHVRAPSRVPPAPVPEISAPHDAAGQNPGKRRAAFPREARRSVQGTEGPSRREDGGHGHEAPCAGRVPPAYTSFSRRPHFTDEETEQIRSRGASGSRREPGARREFRGFQEPGADRLSFADPCTRGDASVQGLRRVRPGSAGPVWPRGLASSLLSLF